MSQKQEESKIYFCNKCTEVVKRIDVKEESKHKNENELTNEDLISIKFTYGDWVDQILTVHTQSGLDETQIREVIRIRTWLLGLKPGDKVEIDKMDVRLLKEGLTKIKWQIAHEDLLEFMDYIRSLDS